MKNLHRFSKKKLRLKTELSYKKLKETRGAMAGITQKSYVALFSLWSLKQ